MPAVDRNLEEMSVEEIRRHFASYLPDTDSEVLARLKADRRAGVRRIHDALRRRLDRERREHARIERMLVYERGLWRAGVRWVAGVDEVGVGPLAGPVVAAAVVFPPDTTLAEVDDSKRLDAASRARLARGIREIAAGISIGSAGVDEIDRLNIRRAGLLAMRRAIAGLSPTPQHVLVDAMTIPALAIPQNALIKGDRLSFSIAAASIIAKTHRDHWMERLDAEYPGYGFAQHKGYGTEMHHDAIDRLGPCAIHRRSFTLTRAG